MPGARVAYVAVVVPIVLACGSPSTSAVRSAADLHCTLPVVSEDHIGFVDLPSGQFRSDPAAPTTDHKWLFYAQATHRWVKVFDLYGYELISPDGTQVIDSTTAYSPDGAGGEGTSEVYVRDTATYLAHVVGRVPGRARPIAWLTDGIYLDNGNIVRFDPGTGRSTEIHPSGPDAAKTRSGLWFWINPSAAWYGEAPFPNQADRNPIFSMSLKDGKLTNWYTAPNGRSVSIIGFIAPDKPLVVEFNPEPSQSLTGDSFMILSAPGVSQKLDFDSSINPWGVTDSMGVWLDSPGRLWLYSNSGLMAMADLRATFGSELPRVAGLCK